MQKTMEMDIMLPVGSAEAYVQRVFGVPVLSAEEERALAVRLRENNDLEAARRLVLSQLRYVVYIARGYSGYGLAQADLIQEGNIGLMKAVKRFDPSMNVRLVSFAVHWIRAEMHEFILKNWRIVKVATTKAQRKLFFNLRSSKKRLGWFSKDEIDIVASDLGVKPETVLEMEARMSNFDVCFDPLADDSDPDIVTAPAAYLTEPKEDPAIQLELQNWDEYKIQQLTAALGTLNDRSRDIVERRWLAEKKSTLHELAIEYQVSAERIRQIESSAMKKLKAVFEL
ncbi:RNA polymerase sigma factor RpoH [hydrothermal vent metagenome]|uniref:RNA polymerase sigma factor RpoH n=1 Tax=hydrothermal vent metagenome TaxID=652676 RepID=A0A3B0ZJ07_9ZZZZ